MIIRPPAATPGSTGQGRGRNIAIIGKSRLLGPLLTLKRIFPLLWASAPGWALLGVAMMVAEIGFGLAALYLVKQLIDSVTAVLSSTDGAAAGLDSLTRAVVLTGACTLAYVVARSVSGLAREAQGLFLAEHINQLIHQCAVRADLAFYESPRYFDTLQRARAAGSQRPAQVVSNLLMLGKNALLMTGVVVLMGSINWLLLGILALVIVPALGVRLYFTRHLYEWRKRRTQMERQAGYLDWLMTSDLHAKEIRLGQLGDHLRRRYQELRAKVRDEQLRIGHRRTRYELAVATLATLAFFGALGYLALQTVQGKNSVGDLALFLVIFQRAQAMGQEVVQQLSQLYEDQLYLGLLFEFMDIEPVLAEPASPAPMPAATADGLRIEGVGFRYPGTDRDVLRDINLHIPDGRVVALVGANGSGKTSLIKLMCRLYDPTRGRITLDGQDIRGFALDDYRRQFSVIFQDYARYAASVRENIRLGDVRLPEDSPRVPEAAVKSGADPFIRDLNLGYDTPLSRMFDNGTEISQGQWQKVALARAFVPDSRIIVLDEPTSALDPMAEYELFKDFRTIIGKRSALVISHRLSTIRQADFIYVLDDGEIRESGTHDELMARQGTYAGLFDRQAHFYRDTITAVAVPPEAAQ